MAENAAPTLVPKRQSPDVLEVPTPVQVPSISSETKALFDSIADDRDSAEEGNSSPAQAFFAGLLWVGYAIAIVVALVLVWSAVNGLLRTLPR